MNRDEEEQVKREVDEYARKYPNELIRHHHNGDIELMTGKEWSRKREIEACKTTTACEACGGEFNSKTICVGLCEGCLDNLFDEGDSQ